MNFFDIDLEILKFINQPFVPTFNFAFILTIFSVYGYLAFLLFYFFRTKQKDKMFRILIISVVGILLVNAIKFSVNRPRPSAAIEGVNQILIKSDPSFPSSHTFIAILCAFFTPKSFSRFLRILLNFYLVILIPIGLVYIGVHYPSDVLVGGLLAFLIVKFFNEKRANSIKSSLKLKF
ncbi:MAG: phosphatase PAP2 family protein [Candidatus Aenigmarchaeota archaeon]|nr:phosphatase PAP2 family protein [Candidatus Aenigmarchaeota archaeon]